VRRSSIDVTGEQAYRIVIDGELGGWLAHYVGGATVTAAHGTTTIVGLVGGPSEFAALARVLSDLGLEIESAALL
jgi:hypothetical protein